MRLLPAALLACLLGSPGTRAELGASREACIARYGAPVRDALKSSGLLCFERDGLSYIAHFFHGNCDVLSIFSSREEFGVPESLPSTRITALLESEGGGPGWEPLEGTTINGVWDSPDRKSFAIYDTMRHKLVLMTREAYHREKEEKRKAIESARDELATGASTDRKKRSAPSPTPATR